VHLGISGAKRLAGALKTDRPRIMNALISSLFSSLTRVTRGASEAELELLSADAPEPLVRVGTTPPGERRHPADVGEQRHLFGGIKSHTENTRL
jgi:hypothetical protein